jgi:hypothetical protein
MGHEVKPFSFGNFIAGGVVAVAVGVIGNAIAMAISGALFGKSGRHNPVVGGLIGIIPGVALIFLSRRLSHNGMSLGMLLVAIPILLTGGLCGGGVAGLFG